MYLTSHYTFVVSNYLGPCGQSLPGVQAQYFRSRRPVLPTPPDGWGGLMESSFVLKVCIDAYPAVLERRADTEDLGVGTGGDWRVHAD